MTGFTILISGYTQLPCGLSTYHWQVLVYLAWFSSLTHLSCLTFLRSYLHKHPGERVARLVAMLLFVILLAVSIAITGAFDWRDNNEDSQTRVFPADSTICYIQSVPDKSSIAFISMIFSLLLLLLGFTTRVVKSSVRTSTFVTGTTKQLSDFYQTHVLAKLYDSAAVQKEPWKLKWTLGYRPLLVIFLVTRALVDAWNSMLFEVRYNFTLQSFGDYTNSFIELLTKG